MALIVRNGLDIYYKITNVYDGEKSSRQIFVVSLTIFNRYSCSSLLLVVKSFQTNRTSRCLSLLCSELGTKVYGESEAFRPPQDHKVLQSLSSFDLLLHFR